MSEHQSRRARPFLPLVVAALVPALLVACSGDDDDAPATAAAGPAVTVAGSKATVLSSKGALDGSVNTTTLTFLGVPYALPPTGARRWQPPAAAAPWTATRDATQFAKHCPQEGSAMSAQPSASEDCLYLNVYLPKALGTAQPGAKRAVMVWIYGGANAVGTSETYDPTPLVESEDVVAVTINYRVGALGFLAHPALDAESHAAVNYGVMDQQLALKWVQDNIAAFGGDPANVTVFGESAGGLNTLSHIVSPLSAGLFHKAIVQSGAYTLSTPTLAASEARGTAFATRLGCTDQSAACLRSKTVDEVLAQQGTVNTASAAYNQSTVDGKVLVEAQRAALQAGRINRVPVMQGANSNEGRVFTSPSITQAAYEATIAGYAPIAGKTAAEALAAYPLSRYYTPFEAAAAAVGDFAFACSSRTVSQALANWVTTYAYEFADPNAGTLGATHGAEIVYLMRTGPAAGRGWDAAGESLALSKAMRRYWGQFAKTGNPNAADVPNWAPYSAAADNVQWLVTPAPKQDTGLSARHNCAFWG